ncbi:unnamed protein product (macronuclear) [Paramecium tetraurelia]|uniref:Uncharacterized protein n=1 Tax=Paramecium tetraurelia TaxID=5888 RepID=A0D5Q8_PARTE|nr:uncharacterized protein GSPATT00013805001 [Paramecium tetraurelia]CAK78375.1 unnamed protein product [Paramecium tetraurelia]|eukprot:XP_001445772.1 hypothetical protein (macronuclear) [Paramecium tetraurelia strain d4-2]
MLNQPFKPSNKVVSLHAIMSNIKRQNKQKTRSISYHSNHIKSEGQSIQLRDDDSKKFNDQIKQKDELINQLQSQQQSFRKQLNEIFEVNHDNDESLILHIYSSIIQFKKEKSQYLQQDEINSKVILHYKQLFTDIIANQEEQLSNQQQLLMTLTNQIKENELLQHLNTSQQEKQYMSKIESLQSQIDKFRNASLLLLYLQPLLEEKIPILIINYTQYANCYLPIQRKLRKKFFNSFAIPFNSIKLLETNKFMLLQKVNLIMKGFN